MNYCEIEIKGEKIGLYYSIHAIYEINKDEVIADSYAEFARILAKYTSYIYRGYQNYCAKKFVIIKFTREDIYEFVEKLDWMKGLPQVLSTVTEALNYAVSEVNDSYKPSENGVLEGSEKKN